MNQNNKIRSANGPDDTKPEDQNIDHLLQQAFKDDMPQAAKTAMKEQLDQFRLMMEQAKTRKTSADQKMFQWTFRFGSVRWTHFLFKKEVIIMVSLMMIVLGSFIQSAGSPNRLTENLSVLGTSVVVSDEISRSYSMECSIELFGESQKSLNYSIQWLTPNLSKIRVKDSNDTPLKTIWISEEEIVIVDHVHDIRYKKKHPAHLDEPIIKPIVGYLAPTELLERMYGEWQLKQYQEQKECAQGTFTIGLPNERETLEVTIDLCTYLPRSIKKICLAETYDEEKLIFSIQYSWNVPLSRDQLSPKPIKDNKNT